jgi:hypothetical protein
MQKLIEPEFVEEKNVPYPAEYSIGVLESTVDKRLRLFDIPGQGNKTKEGCGHVIHVSVCPECRSVHPHDYHCKNFSCPVCYPFAALQGAVRAAKKIVGVEAELRKMKINPGYVNHLMISLPDYRLHEFLYSRGINKGKVNFEKLKEFFYQAAQEIGVLGGYLVIHPGRGKNELKSAIIECLKDEGDEHPRAWKGIQANALELDDWREYVDFGVHAHITGYFKMKETSDQFYKRTGGCTYKNITVDSCRVNKVPVRPEDFDSLKAIITYELGHHAYREGKHGITQFGILKAWKEVREGTDYFYEKCDECDTELVRISTLEYGNFLVDKNSVILENKKKILRSKPIIRYLLHAKYKEDYLQISKNKLTEDEQKIRDYLEQKRKIEFTEDPPVKSIEKKYVPFKVKEDYVTLRLACIYS